MPNVKKSKTSRTNLEQPLLQRGSFSLHDYIEDQGSHLIGERGSSIAFKAGRTEKIFEFTVF